MENLHYGNWIRLKLLCLLGLTSLTFAVLASLPFDPWLRLLLALTGIGTSVSFIYPLYSYFIFSPAGGNLQDKIYVLILSHLANDISGKLVDIGTGNGILAIKAALQHPALEVIAVDHWGRDWGNARSICERNAIAAGVAERVNFMQGNAAALDFPDACFDVVLSNLTFHEVKMVSHKGDVMREALRLLKLGGAFVFIDYFYDERYYGEIDEFSSLLRNLKLAKFEFKPLRDELTFPRLLRHKRALGKVGIIYGVK